MPTLLRHAVAFPWLIAATALASAAPPEVPPAPVARVEPVADTYFGETLTDRYRWMENDRDPDWLPYLRNQDRHARAALEALPRRDALLARIRELSGDVAVPKRVQRARGRWFFQQRPEGANNFKLFVREGGKVRLLIDPTMLDSAESHFSLDWWEASPDGAKVVYGLSKDGSEDSTLQIIDVASGAVLPERIPDTETARPQWLSDSSGFFYNQLTGKVGTPERYLDSRARFHRLGSDAGADPIVMARGRDPDVSFDRIQAPFIATSTRSDRVVLELRDVRSEERLLIAPAADVLAGKARWQPVAEFADEVTDFDLDGDSLYLLANRGHPRGRLLKTSARNPQPAAASEVVPESALVLQSLARGKDGLYLQAMEGGLGRLQRLGADGSLADVALPFDGTVEMVAAEPSAPGALLILSGWFRSTGIWAVDADGRVADTGLTPKPSIDTGNYVSERRFATAGDGTRIPYTLIYRKGLRRDGDNPAFVSAYGSYGYSAYTPFFVGRGLALADQGFIVGYASVRGGGEYGRDWHRAGQLANKPNTWRDLIAVCQDMIANDYTKPARLAIGGRSAGGITVGRAMTERPDLFAAVVSGVGWHNPLRYVAEQDGYGEEPEWGSIGDEAGYRALKGIDSYQAVTDGTRYPAMLLTTGVTDPRVAPFHPAKMAARLQAASASGKPVLLRVDFDAGHGIGSTRSQQDSEAADTYAFLLWQTGASGSPPAAGQPGGAEQAAAVLKPGDNLVLENIPPIPMKIAEDTARYEESRPAALFDWHPARREIVIGTRFADTTQVHAVAMPGGARRQLTFFADRVQSARYLPDGKSFLFQKDVGGGEWFQIYRYDLGSGAVTLITDGRSRNASYLLAHHSTTLAFTSTRRNNKDVDVWVVDANPPQGGSPSARLLMQVEGGGWEPLAWSWDNRRLLVRQFISINESYLWLVDASTGERKQLTSGPLAARAGETVAYAAATFSRDDRSLYVVTDRDSEFQRLARIDLETLQVKYLTGSIPWDVDQMAASEDGRAIAFVANENGYGRIYLLDTATETFHPLPGVPAGVVSSLQFHPSGRDLGFTVASARSPADVYSIDVESGRLERWTEGEIGGLNAAAFVEPKPIKWKSFDGLELSGFLYQPDAARFPGKRPVIVSIHGGPEAQFRPNFRGQDNYLIDELGVAIVAPNVRGSSGYGKSFLKLDNGYHREDTYKDIDALLDWIGRQPQLDAGRVMVYGGSYGGHMTWAVSAFYNDRIRCAMPVVGMSNLVTFLEHTESYRRDLRRVEYGDERDPQMRAYLEKIAPLNHLEAMHKPVFAVVGRNDPRVPWTESRQIIDRLNAQGTPTWFLAANDEGHGYAKKKNRDFLFDAEVLFIDRCLLNEMTAGK